MGRMGRMGRMIMGLWDNGTAPPVLRSRPAPRTTHHAPRTHIQLHRCRTIFWGRCPSIQLSSEDQAVISWGIEVFDARFDLVAVFQVEILRWAI